MVATRSSDLSVLESMMPVDPIEIKSCLQVSGGGLGRRVTIPPELLKEDNGSTFIHCSTVPKCIASLFVGRGTGAGAEERRFSRTNVFEVITKLRNAKINEHTNSREPQETLNICGSSTKPKRISADQKLEAPVSVEIDAPRFGEVQGISMRVMLGWRKSAPLFVECTPANIAYLRGACQYQLESGGIKRTRAKKRQIDCVEHEKSSDESQDEVLPASSPGRQEEIHEHAEPSSIEKSPPSESPQSPEHLQPQLLEKQRSSGKRALISDFFTSR